MAKNYISNPMMHYIIMFSIYHTQERYWQ